MLRTLQLLILAKLFATVSYSQFLGPGLFEKIDTLRGQGIDTIIRFNVFSSGPRADFCCDTVFMRGAEYLLWKSGSKTFFQKFVECFPTNTEGPEYYITNVVSTDTSLVFKNLAENFTRILSDKVVEMVVRVASDSDEVFLSGRPFHGGHYNFHIYLPDTTVERIVNRYDVEKKTFSGLENLNYSYNRSTKLWHFIAQILKEMQELDDQGLFRYK